MMRCYSKITFLVAGYLIFAGCGDKREDIIGKDGFQSISLKSAITGVRPMTGMVLWEELNSKNTDAIQMEYSYMRYDDVVNEKSVYDWTVVENTLNSVASRSHQAMPYWNS